MGKRSNFDKIEKDAYMTIDPRTDARGQSEHDDIKKVK